MNHPRYVVLSLHYDSSVVTVVPSIVYHLMELEDICFWSCPNINHQHHLLGQTNVLQVEASHTMVRYITYIQVLLFEPSEMKQNEFVYLPSYIAYHHESEGDGEAVSGWSNAFRY